MDGLQVSCYKALVCVDDIESCDHVHEVGQLQQSHRLNRQYLIKLIRLLIISHQHYLVEPVAGDEEDHANRIKDRNSFRIHQTY